MDERSIEFPANIHPLFLWLGFSCILMYLCFPLMLHEYKCQWKVSFMLAHTKLVGRRLSILSRRLFAPKLMAIFTFSQAIYTNCPELLTSLGTMKDNKDEGCIFSLTELWRPGHKSFKQKGLNRPRGVLAAAERRAFRLVLSEGCWMLLMETQP